jgi:hypothetical protein
MAYQKEMDISKSTIQSVHDALGLGENATLTVYNNSEDVITGTDTNFDLTAILPTSFTYCQSRLIPRSGTNGLSAILTEMTQQSVTIALVVCINDSEDEITNPGSNNKIQVGEVSFNMWQDPPDCS